MDDDLLAAMYLDDGEESVEKKPTEATSTGFNRTRIICVGAVKYEVPTLEYMQRLEYTLNFQQKMINSLRQELATLRHDMSLTRNFLNRQSDHVREVRNQLDNKLDLRDSI